MLAYLILAGRDGSRVDQELIRRFDQDAPSDIPFLPDERIVWRNVDGSVVFFGWQAFTEVAGIGSHWVVDDRRLTAFTGHCWPRSTGWVHGTDQSWAMQLRTYLGQRPDLPAMRESLFGQFTLLSLSTDGSGWAMPDWMNVDQLFVSEERSTTAVSNRAGLCARAAVADGATPQRSLAGAGWLISVGWMLDQESGYWDVERPRPGSFVAFEPGSGARIVEPTQSPVLPPAPEDPAPSYEELLDEADRDLRATIRAIARLPTERRVLSLSGGKDSRTLAAIILSEDLQDRFRFVTSGSPERADPRAAGAIAGRFALDWTLEDPTSRSPELELENALLHTGLMEGMSSAWGTFVRPAFSPIPTISGVLGEALRWGPVSRSSIGSRSVEDVLAGLRKARPIDPLGVLRPDARAYYQTYVTDWIRQQATESAPLVSVATISMHEQLARSRNGPDCTWSPRLRINPYLTPACLRSNHRLPVDQRPDFRFHVDLQRRCSVELSKMPFAESSWPETAIWHLPDAEEYRRIEPIFSNDSHGRTWRQKRYADYRPLIESILLDRANPIQELLDYDRLVDRVASGDANAGRTRLIWGALTAAIWMGRCERPVKLTRDETTHPLP